MKTNTDEDTPHPSGDKESEAAQQNPETPNAENIDTVTDDIEEQQHKKSSRWADATFTLEQLQSKHADAWTALIRILQRIAERYVTDSFTNPGDLQPLTFPDAEDLTSEIIVKIYEKIASFKSLDHLEASFRKQLKHNAISLKREKGAKIRGEGKVYPFGDPELAQQKRTEQIDIKYEQKVKPYTAESIENDAPSASESIGGTVMDARSDSDLAKIIFDCATELDSSERDLLNRIYQDQQHNEIAKALDIGTSSVGARLQRVYEKLASMIQSRLDNQELRDYGINPD